MSYETIIDAHMVHAKFPKATEMLVADEDGWTVAHYLASRDLLPEWFDDWLLADQDGVTVAHAAASVKKLPANFPHWKAASEGGVTVFHTACMHGMIEPMSKAQIDKICNLKDKHGRTPYDLYMEHGRSKIEGLRKILKNGNA